MSVRLTVAVLALFLAVAGYIYFHELTGPGAATPTPRPGGPRILTLDPQTINRFEATFEGKTTVVVKDGDGRWRVELPEPGPANAERMDDMAQRVGTMRAERAIGDKLADLKPFGLDPPVVVARVTTSTGQRVEIHVGNETLASGGYFVKLASDTAVYSVSTFTAGRLKGLVLEPPRAPTPSPR